MELNPIVLRNHKNNILAEIVKYEFSITPRLFGHRLIFTFHISPKGPQDCSLLGVEADLYFIDGQKQYLMGRLLSEMKTVPYKLEGPEIRIKKYLDIGFNDLIILADKSYKSDVTLEFSVSPQFLDDPNSGCIQSGQLKIPQSDWLKYLNTSGMARFDLIAIRTPIATSHLYPPFAAAIQKIREAEREYMKGNWNSAAGACRDAWRTLLSDTPAEQKSFGYLLGNVIADPARKEFALALIKGLNDVLNKAKHLEGDQKAQTPPTELKQEDALLCIHWYTAVIGYLASVNDTNAGTSSNP